MDRDEIRMRCIEAAAPRHIPHDEGYVAGVLEAAKKFEAYIVEKTGEKGTLTLPKKGA